jgi:hypothetical protein
MAQRIEAQVRKNAQNHSKTQNYLNQAQSAQTLNFVMLAAPSPPYQ